MHGLDFLNDPIDGGTFLLLVVLYFLGARLMQGDAKLRLVGKRIAIAGFFLFVFVLARDGKPGTADEGVRMRGRSAMLSSRSRLQKSQRDSANKILRSSCPST